MGNSSANASRPEKESTRHAIAKYNDGGFRGMRNGSDVSYVAQPENCWGFLVSFESLSHQFTLKIPETNSNRIFPFYTCNWKTECQIVAVIIITFLPVILGHFGNCAACLHGGLTTHGSLHWPYLSTANYAPQEFEENENCKTGFNSHCAESDAMHHSSTIRIDFRMCAAHTRSHMSKLEAKSQLSLLLSPGNPRPLLKLRCLPSRRVDHTRLCTHRLHLSTANYAAQEFEENENCKTGFNSHCAESDAMHHSSTIRIDFRMCAAHTRSHMSKLEAKVIDGEFLSKCLSTRKGEH
ncbi:hypothetical protein CDAR_37901 [Caerostris darwini]|uniref:Uncharacterized protein n=1 Tax=Caerostris darwini TaxID=1538125 RepID=A0AAV4T7H3_9ARAC|nr:hypothetical protein CDAR_37901 [Caerostris darwini]